MCAEGLLGGGQEDRAGEGALCVSVRWNVSCVMWCGERGWEDIVSVDVGWGGAENVLGDRARAGLYYEPLSVHLYPTTKLDGIQAIYLFKVYILHYLISYTLLPAAASLGRLSGSWRGRGRRSAAVGCGGPVSG